MYLKRTNRTDHSIEELEAIDHETITPESPEAAPFLPLREYEYSDGFYSIFHEVAYWRKFNALHNWFVSRVQGGVDECQLSEIDEETLVELIDDLRAVSNGEPVDDLEPIGGFFFGSTGIDEWYFQDLEDTKRMLQPIIDAYIESKELGESSFKHPIYEYEFYYHSSW